MPAIAFMPGRNGTSPDRSLIARLRRRMLTWYSRHARDLPWRPTPRRKADPYHVLVSEAMLQQTQVATVIDYFHRFIEAFPTLRDLAEADEQAVLRLWQGLGYYRRARHLHAAARAIVDHHGGKVPGAVAALMQLPGVGRYSAGAIASIAFNRRAPVVDGNVARVLARWFAITEPIDAGPTRQALWRLAERLTPPGRPGDFNQSLMELGATVCTPRRPRCLVCPVAELCRANRRGLAETLPYRPGRAPQRRVTHHVLAVQRAGRFLFEQRPGGGLWPHMWQLPTTQDHEPDIRPDALIQWCSARYGVRPADAAQLDAFEHQTTHRLISFTLWRARRCAGRLRPGAAVWRRLDDIDDLPLSNPQRRMVQRLRQDRAQRAPARRAQRNAARR